ncbi:DUF3320 domain-containing protein [Chitinimonas arctica]|uniref:DUF3320 domain-containing protein n=2 Tax=Chitinimonas arctica TaxID=2594795 RepID=A0A516SMF1_9NEIS|nr:DUF3320 domain-containing protein [Chitinimonas arctica]
MARASHGESAEQQPEATQQEAVRELKIEATFAAKLNLADFQNAVPLIRELRVVSTLERDSKALEVVLEAIPAFVKPRTWRLDSVGAGQTYQLQNLDVQLDGVFFSRLTEAEEATVSVTLRPVETKASDHSITVTKVVELLPRNQWGGIAYMPDMIAAFVQPNEPAIDRLLKKAADVLRDHGKDAGLDGYKGGAKRAWELASAIWGAVVAMKLDYALPPASFEHTGQKIRSPGQIVDSGLATCLDLALLFCSAIEQAGLNPILVFTRGHAFVGVWLKSEEFSTAVVDDVTALRKRVKLKELLLFETTLVTQRPPVSFLYATGHGAGQIAEEKAESFELAVDIRRARLQRIKPLASTESQVATVLTDALDSSGEAPFEEAPELPEEDCDIQDAATLDPKDRLARWQRKLLDLSLRNNLLNFRAGKKSLKLDAPDPGALEDLVADGKEIKLLTRPDLMDGSDLRDQAIHESRERENLRRAHALDALKRREVFVGLAQEELDVRLVELYRAARTTLQEGGVNTLFLALGFLNWTPDNKPDHKYRAPLILIPVTLQRKSVRSGFTLTLHDDEPRFNPTLLEMLRQDFKLELGIKEGELDRDESGLDIDKIWRTVSAAIKDIKGWEVSEDVVLSMFSFAKYLMWVDLVQRTDQLRLNPVVKHLIDTPREPYAGHASFPSPKSLDRDFGPEHTFCPLPADSSQLSAVMAAARGKDFVLIGPPGTGKSQTISNLIAQCLAEGKRVLFVSEKIAALDVVYRRLREVKLGEFCLELHSSKARKLDVLAQLKTAWEAQGVIDADAWKTEAERLKTLRQQLNGYVERLHHRHTNGRSIYEAIGIVVDSVDVPTLGFSWSSYAAHGVTDTDLLREVVDRLEVNATAVGQQVLASGPLSPILTGYWSPTWQQALIEAAKDVILVAENVRLAASSFLDVIGLSPTPLSKRPRAALAALSRALPQAAGRSWQFVFQPDAKAIAERLQEGIKLLAEHGALTKQLSSGWMPTLTGSIETALDLLAQRREIHGALSPWPHDIQDGLRKGIGLLERIGVLEKKLSVRYTEGMEQLNVYQLQREYAKAEQSLWPMSWLGKRKVRQILETMVAGQGEPNVADDLAILVGIRDTRSEVAKLDIGPEVAELWQGLKSRPEYLRAALKLQEALKAARERATWSDEGLDSLASGRAGESLALEVKKLRKLTELDHALNVLSGLESQTEGLWKGLDTDALVLDAALRFAKRLEVIRPCGHLEEDIPEIAQGVCGERFFKDHTTLRIRDSAEGRLRDLSELKDATGGLWCELETNIQEVERAVSFQSAIATAIVNLAAGPSDLPGISSAIERLVVDGNALLDQDGPVVAAGQKYMSAWSKLQPAIGQLAQKGGFSEQVHAAFSESDLVSLHAHCHAIVLSETKLNAWCAWKKVRQHAVSIGLEPLVAGIENKRVELGAIRSAFETNYCRWWLNAVVDNESVIRTFVSAEHEKRIADFRHLDEKFTELTRTWVRASLCSGLPSQDDATRNSEWGLLRREFTKKRGHLPLRELISGIPSALTKLTPCLLMSPLSIAQFLAPDTEQFDVVVFDEASQIAVWDAIGAIARGKQVVMVGDPKQLPPTAFFDRAESSIDDEDVEGEMESILDECLGANLPTLNLSWHYRSRNESLIAFSNQHYYGGGLVTFPSPVTEDRAVSFHYTNGVYEKGGARINKLEAKALVADIVALLKSPGFRESELTIGVVTFNTEQQKLIEDLLDEERRKDPSLEPHFSEAELEPLFVKNLESVQGDERDIMYFSITYGPDVSGAKSMNFGPMNRDGGERRLNVAITRARQELRVFSSFKPEQFDLSRTQSVGVRDLKHFLEFAERGPRALAEATRGSLGGFESPFEEAVASALAMRGWELHTQVGASAFRVDLGVVHPDARGTYLTGIECDGATYHRSATARDRDKLREQVLRGLGWEIVRVWSTDWWVDKPGTLDRLDQQLRALLESSRAKRALEAEREVAKRAAEAAIAKASSPIGSDEYAPKPAADHIASTTLSVEETHVAEQYARNAAVQTAENADLPQMAFVETDLSHFATTANADAFFEVSYEPTLAAMIALVTATEGPVLDAVLARRISRAHGWQRTGSRIVERVEEVARKYCRNSEEEVGTFYWPETMAPGSPVSWRPPVNEQQRAIDEVCAEELRSLAALVYDSTKGEEWMLVQMARQLGLMKLRAASRPRLEIAIKAITA